MSVKTFAPKGFRFKHLVWREGRRYCSPEDIKLIKTIPPETPVLDRMLKVINKPKSEPKTDTAKKDKPKKAGTTNAIKSNKRKNTE